MFLALHPFQKAGYCGLLVGTGLARPSAPRTIWKDMFSEFDEHLFGQINDVNVTRIPTLLAVPSGVEEALALESARSHCIRKYQKTFQESLSLGLCVSKSHDAEKTKLLFLNHPAFYFGMFDLEGSLLEFRVSGASSTWTSLEAKNEGAFCLFSKGIKSRNQDMELFDLKRDRLFRFASMFLESSIHPVFNFLVEGGRHEI